jgi:hypothetical protein
MLRQILQSRWFTAVVGAIVVFFLVSILKLEAPLATVRREIGNIGQKINDLNKASATLEKTKAYYESEAFLERLLRLKLNYKKPDENVVFVYKNKYNQNSDNSVESGKDLKNWQKWLNFLWSK